MRLPEAEHLAFRLFAMLRSDPSKLVCCSLKGQRVLHGPRTSEPASRLKGAAQKVGSEPCIASVEGSVSKTASAPARSTPWLNRPQTARSLLLSIRRTTIMKFCRHVKRAAFIVPVMTKGSPSRRTWHVRRLRFCMPPFYSPTSSSSRTRATCVSIALDYSR